MNMNRHYKKLLGLFLSLCFVIFLANTPVSDGPGIGSPQPVVPYLNNIFPDQAPTMGSGYSYVIENAFPNLTFIDPVDMLELPGNKIMVIGKPGYVWIFDNNSTTNQKTLVLDVSNQVVVGADGGMLGAVIHPDFGVSGSPNEGYFYLWYRYHPPSLPENGEYAYLRLSRFKLEANGTVNAALEYPLIQQFDRHDWHNGGDMFFGPDGFLYIAVGDEGGADDQYNVTQQISSWLLGGVLRIDVDQRGGSVSHPIRRHPVNTATPPSGWPNTFTQGYYIPNDNPWLDAGGSILEEFYAIGTRSPHRMTYDNVTGEIWLGDIGQATREEISLVEKGANLQWPYKEGIINGPKAKPNPLIGFDQPPVFDYPRDFGRCVIGGFVVRGNKYPELEGKYIFGDHEVQNVWTLEQSQTGGAPDVQFLLNVPLEGTGAKDGISSFYSGADGTIYILDLYGTNQDGGKIHKLVRITNSIPDPPEKLSDLGVFTNLATLETVPGIIPYTVNTPLWSDRAEKKRWIALPNDGHHNSPEEQIVFQKDDFWKFPAGTVLIKHFELPVDENNPAIVRRLETRFIVFDKFGSAYGLTYKWNDAGTEAFRLQGAETKDFTVTKLNGSTYTQTWEFPSRQQCLECHNANAGYALGVRTRQLNGDFTYPSGISANQIETWEHLGMFNSAVEAPVLLPQSTPIDNPQASTEFKVRSYWDANCSFCHRPNGVNAVFDARGKTPIHDQKIINTTVESNASPMDGIVVTPQNTGQSVLWIRDNSISADAMPPLAKNLVDDQYMTLLTGWINELDLVTPIVIPSGWYFMEVVSSQKVLTVKNDFTHHQAAIIQLSDGGIASQKWHFQHLGQGKYRITNANSQLVLSTRTWLSGEGAFVVQENWSGAQNQIWFLKQNDNGFYNISNAYNGLHVSIKDGSNAEGAQVFLQVPSITNPAQQFEFIPTISSNLACVTYLSDINWSGTPVNGWGPPEKDRSNGETGATDGNTITINGRTYTKGLGVHANSEIIYNLAGNYQRFFADIGVDDETCSAGSVQFEVYHDGMLSYQSPVLNHGDDAISIEINTFGVNELKLVVNDGGNGISCDHGDWADARLESCNEDLCTSQNAVAQIIAPCTYKIKYVDSEESSNGGEIEKAFDGDNNTIWHTEWVAQDPVYPHEVQLDMGSVLPLSGLTYLPRQDGSYNGTIKDYSIYVSQDGVNWGNPVAMGTWPTTKSLKQVDFQPVDAQYIRLIGQNEVNGNPWASAAEIRILTTPCTDRLNTIGEAGKVDISSAWTTVTLNNNYADPVIVTGGPSYNNNQSGSARIRNITSNSFQIRFEEWECQDGSHPTESIGYVVIESGIHTLQNGKTIMAGKMDGITQNWTTVNYPKPFGVAPILFTQCLTTNETQAVTTRIDHTQSDPNQFTVKFQEGNGSNNTHAPETIGWIALEPSVYDGYFSFEAGNTGTIVDEVWETIQFGQCYGSPVFIGQIHSNNGADLVSLRQRNLTNTSIECITEEETCTDSEIAHGNEDVHFWVLSAPGNIYGTTMVIAKTKVLLQGPLSGSEMSVSLADNNNLPLAQPYLNTPWQYKGNECVDAIPVDVVDWVLVQVRHPQDPAYIMEQKACFIRKDGVIIDMEGSEGINLGDLGVSSAYISVVHRNHLSIMTKNPVALHP